MSLPPARHGTDSKYHTGCRCHECTMAHKRAKWRYREIQRRGLLIVRAYCHECEQDTLIDLQHRSPMCHWCDSRRVRAVEDPPLAAVLPVL
jgi:hypothetical protein